MRLYCCLDHCVILAVLASVLLLSTLPCARAASQPPTLDPTYGLPLPARRAVPKAEPDASWIWADQVKDGQTVTLRASFDLKRVPKRATIYVTADDFFTLFINGKELDHSAPDPNDSLVWKHTHRIDVASSLTLGKNVIALRAINAGGAAGAIARLEADGKPTLLTGPQWKVSEASDLPASWTTVNYDDSGWQQAHVEGPLTSDPWGSAGGLENWPNYVVDVPYLAHLSLPPVALLDPQNGAGKCEIDAQKPDGVMVAPGTSDGAPPSVVVDFGKEIAGRVELISPRRLTVTVGTGESREEAVKSPWGGVSRLELEPGRKAYSPYSAFRYAKLTFLNPAGEPAPSSSPIPVQIALDHKYYPVEYRGSFACSDDLLTRIWYTGAYTAHLCMQEDIWDAPKRDRARWMGDLHVSGDVIDTVFADRFLMEQTMQRLRDEAQGGKPASELPRAHVNGISGYSCAWICGLADFHRHLGDYDYLRKQHDLLISMLAFMRDDLNENGLFANRHNAWPFVDWAPDFNGDGPRARSATQFFYIKAAREAGFLFSEMGDTAQAAASRDWAEQLTKAAQTGLLQPDGKTFSDRRQDNAMAICAGATTPEQTAAIYDAVLQPDSADWGRFGTPYYNDYVIQAMSLAGHTDGALEVIRRIWGGMLNEGATSFWEGYDPTWEKSDFHAHLQADNGTGYFVSLCHGWSAGPTSWLTERVLGVRPTSGGFKTVEIVPDLADLKWAEGDVPTPGKSRSNSIRVRAERNGNTTTLSVTLPSGIDALVGVPGQSLTLNGRSIQPEQTQNGRAYIHIKTAGKFTLIGQ